MIIKGKVFKFGCNIDTDQIYPGRYVELTDENEIAKHAMEGADPDFVKDMNEGDIIVAGSNFGCGSSREHAVIALMNLGVGAVIAPSFGRIFYRNALNLGFPLVTLPESDEIINDGDYIKLDFDNGKLILNDNKSLKLSDEYKLVKKAYKANGFVNLYVNQDVDLKEIFS